MLVKCNRDNTTFEAHEVPYPGAEQQTKHHCEGGDKYIECPTCARRYFFHTATGKWSSDRDLQIIS